MNREQLQKVRDALSEGCGWSDQILADYDEKYARHPATEADREFITDSQNKIIEALDILDAALQSCPDCGKPTPPDSTHTCLPQQPDDWEGIAADQALTIAMLQLDKQCLLEGLQYAVKQVPSLGDVPGIRSQLAAVPDSDAVNATLETMQQEQSNGTL